MDEKALVDAAKRGNAQAFCTLVETHQRALVASAWQMTHNRDDAEDLAQEACVAAYQQLRTLQDTGKFRPWLFAILRHKCYRYLKQRHPEEFSMDEFADMPATDSPFSAFAELFELVEQLPLSYREVLIAHYLHELSYAEIALVLGSNEQAIRMRCLRAREQLRVLAKRAQEEEAVLTRSAQIVLGGITTALVSRVSSELGVTAHAATAAMPHLSISPAPAPAVAGQALAAHASWPMVLKLGIVLAAAAGVAGGALLYHAGQVNSAPKAIHTGPPDAATLQRLNAVRYRPTGTISASDLHNARVQLPITLAVDADSNVYVIQCDDPHVKKFSRSGRFLTQFCRERENNPYAPASITVGPDGLVYLAASSDSFMSLQIQKFTRNGEFLGQWGVDDQMLNQFDTNSCCLRFNAQNQLVLLYATQDKMYVIHSFVQTYTREGQSLGRWEAIVNGHPFQPWSKMALDTAGNVYMISIGGPQEDNKLTKFSPTGTLLAEKKAGRLLTDTANYSTGVTLVSDAADHLYIGQSQSHYGIRKQTITDELLDENILGAQLATHMQDIAIGPDGSLYVLDIGKDSVSSCIRIFTPEP